MSGTVRRGAPAILTLQRVSDPVRAELINLAFSAIEQYEAGRASRGARSIPAFAGIHLTAADGSTWQLSVNPDGSLVTTVVAR